MKCQIPFPGTNKKNITNFSSAEVAQKVLRLLWPDTLDTWTLNQKGKLFVPASFLLHILDFIIFFFSYKMSLYRFF